MIFKISLLTIFLTVSLNLFSQNRQATNNDLYIIKELASQIEKEQLSDMQAQKTVLNYYLDIKKEIRPYYSELSEEEKIDMDKAQTTLWARVKEVIDMYKNYLGYNAFLRDQFSMLAYYNESIYELLYFLIDNDTSIKVKNDEFTSLLSNKFWNFEMQTPKR